jgi:Fe-S cluster biogenesis protein NfuA
MNPSKVITIYAELTPNPNTMKFVANINLLEGGVVEYHSKEQANNCPMAFQLFDFSGVKSVFITSNFVTITKEPAIDWFDVSNILREFIRGFLMSDEKLFLSNPFESDVIKNNPPPARQPLPEGSAATASAHEIEEKIKSMLEEYVKPAVESDGGAIFFKSFEDGVVTLSLKGSCSGCPSSTITLKAGIENLLKKMVPGVTEVVADAE